MKLSKYFEDLSVTEIVLTKFDQIFIEQNGRLQSIESPFENSEEYQDFVQIVSEESGIVMDLDSPFGNGVWREFRVHIVAQFFNHGVAQICLRRVATKNWTLGELQKQGWCNQNQADMIRNIVIDRKNTIVIGNTGSGKTSVLQSLMFEAQAERRFVILEDTEELSLPNRSSTRIKTRSWESETLRSITLSDLVRESLRMRPDSLVVGEVRGVEAKDLLMALSTGHAGSLGTLHADNAFQALHRLEMLITMGAPQWSAPTVRKLIFLSLQCLILTGRSNDGKRMLKGIYHLASLEDHGLTLEQIG